MENIIEIKNLSKSYKEVKAVDNLSFKVKKGEFFAFLGVNGAGKSTTISIMCGQLQKDSGEVYINSKNCDFEIEKIKNEIGVVYQNSALDKPLTVRENLESRAALYNIIGDEFEEKLKKLSDIFVLNEILNRPYKKLSGGQKRRVDIARALLHDPKILILDEPTTGLDPQTRQLVWEIIHNLRKEKQLTVFLTTHYMEEVVDADYVVILDEGKVAAEGTPNYLKNTYTKDYITLYDIKEDDVRLISNSYVKIREAYRVEVDSPLVATKIIQKHPEIFVDYEITKGKMDDVFLAVTGKKLDKGGNQ